MKRKISRLCLGKENGDLESNDNEKRRRLALLKSEDAYIWNVLSLTKHEANLPQATEEKSHSDLKGWQESVDKQIEEY